MNSRTWAFCMVGLFFVLLLLTACSVSPVPLPSTAVPSTLPSANTPAPKLGVISGRVHLAAPPTPPMTIYALDQASGLWAMSETQAADGEAPFTINVQPGSYLLFAFSEKSAYAAYSEDGWDLTQVKVSENQTVGEIVLRPPSQSECGPMFGVPASPDKRFAAIPGPSEACKAGVINATQQPATSKPVRIEFAPGAISAQIQGSFNHNNTLNTYVLSAMDGQEMSVKLITAGDPTLSGLYLVITGQDRVPLLTGQPKTTFWTGKLSTTQNYYIEVHSAAAAPVDYTLQVAISALTTTR